MESPGFAVSAPTDPALADEIAKADRLARIVVSDIILYNQEKFDAAIQSGDVLSAMDSELAEGRSRSVGRMNISRTNRNAAKARQSKIPKESSNAFRSGAKPSNKVPWAVPAAPASEWKKKE